MEVEVRVTTAYLSIQWRHCVKKQKDKITMEELFSCTVWLEAQGLVSSMALQSIFHFFIKNSELAHQHRNDIYSIEKTDTILPFTSVRDRIFLCSPLWASRSRFTAVWGNSWGVSCGSHPDCVCGTSSKRREPASALQHFTESSSTTQVQMFVY